MKRETTQKIVIDLEGSMYTKISFDNEADMVELFSVLKEEYIPLLMGYVNHGTLSAGTVTFYPSERDGKLCLRLAQYGTDGCGYKGFRWAASNQVIETPYIVDTHTTRGNYAYDDTLYTSYIVRGKEVKRESLLSSPVMRVIRIKD